MAVWKSRLWGGRKRRRRAWTWKARPGVEGLDTRLLLTLGFQQYPVPSAVGAIAVGSDGNVYFAEGSGGAIGVFNPVTKALHDVSIPGPFTGTPSIVRGPDGAIWFTNPAASAIDKIDVRTDQVQSFATTEGAPELMTVGPDGDLWFVGGYSFLTNFIGKMTPGGVATYYNLPVVEFFPLALAAGPDGDIWISDDISNATIRMNTSGQVASVIQNFSPEDLAAGPDGNMWAALNDKIGVVTLPQGTVTTYSLAAPQPGASALVAGPDGNLWFTGPALPNGGTGSTSAVLGTINAQTKAINTFSIPSSGAGASITAVADGAAGDLWLGVGGPNRLTEAVLDSAPQTLRIVVDTAGDQASPAGPSDPNLSLREAVEVANGTLPVTSLTPQQLAQVTLVSGTATRIDFGIPQSDPGFNAASGVWTIAPATPLPTITAPVFIDGYSQAGARPNTSAPGQPDNAVVKIAINGAGAGGTADGLYLQGAGTTVEGLAVGGFQSSDQNTAGIVIDAANVLVAGNLIGTNAAGVSAVPNAIGVLVFASSGSTIGGTTPAARNIVAGNLRSGIDAEAVGGTVPGGMLIQGNDIGTDATGSAALPNNTLSPGPNLGNGFAVAAVTLSSSSNNTIGGAASGAGNVISGNGLVGILLENDGVAATAGNWIAGNLIGVDVSGMTALGNAGPGIGMASVSGFGLEAVTGTTIGGTTAAARNVIAGNATDNTTFSPENANIVLLGDLVAGNVIEGNLVGTNAAGTAAPAGGSPAAVDGVRFDSAPGLLSGGSAGALNNTVSGNVIAFHSGAGVRVAAGTGDAVVGNMIFGNSGLGIDLVGGTQDAFGVTANSPGGPHAGPNALQNYPVLNPPATSAGQTTITGTINSAAGQSFTIEFFASRAADASGHGQGQTFLGRLTNVTTDAGGNSSQFRFTVDGSLGGQAITATATDPNGDTSEFALDVIAPGTPGPPGAPVLSAQSDTGVSSADGITRDNGSAAAPLTLIVSGVSPSDALVQLYDVSNPAGPVPLGNPTQATAGTAAITLDGGADLPLPDGTYTFAASESLTAGGSASALSAPSAAVAIQTRLKVLGVNASANYYNGTTAPLPDGGKIVVTFNHPLAGLSAADPHATGFAGNPFPVMLVPSGPDGLATQQRTGVLWSAPSGIDGGDLPVPATAVYTEDADGTATVTLTPHQPLATDIYLISVNNLFDLAGNPLLANGGAPGNYFTSFDYRPVSGAASAPQVVSVSAFNGTVTIGDNAISPPDTIGIRFSAPMDAYTINTATVQLFQQGVPGALTAAVAYSPSTQSAYLTPETRLTPGAVYYVAVSAAVTDDRQFPAPGAPLAQPFTTSFTVNSTGVGAGSAPLQVVQTGPPNGTAWAAPLGYGALTFSEALSADLSRSLSTRFSAMLVPHTGGVTTGGSGYADVPLNAKLAFNPNTNQLVIVPTGELPNSTVYLFALTGVKAADNDPLSGGTAYSTFLLNQNAAAHSLIRPAADLPPSPSWVAIPATGQSPETRSADVPARTRRSPHAASPAPSHTRRPRRQ